MEQPVRTIDLTQFTPPKQKKGTKKDISNDIIPLHLRSNKELTENTINDYLSKLNIIQKLFLEVPLNGIQKAEIRKPIKGNTFDKSLIDMDYLAEIEKVVKIFQCRSTWCNEKTDERSIRRKEYAICNVRLCKK